MAMKFGQDVRVAILSYRALALWMLGYPKAALADAEQLFADARKINQATTLMYGLIHSAYVHFFRGNYRAVSILAEEAEALAEEKGALLWNGAGIMKQGCVLAVTGHAADAVRMITAGMNQWTATGATAWVPWYRMYLAKAHADLGHFDEAWHNVREAISEIEKSNERWWEAEVNRITGEIALKSPESDAAKAEA
jgi:predicted ATPase